MSLVTVVNQSIYNSLFFKFFEVRIDFVCAKKVEQ